MDADADRGRNAAADGAVGIWRAPGGQLQGCAVWLEGVLREAGAGAWRDLNRRAYEDECDWVLGLHGPDGVLYVARRNFLPDACAAGGRRDEAPGLPAVLCGSARRVEGAG